MAQGKPSLFYPFALFVLSACGFAHYQHFVLGANGGVGEGGEASGSPTSFTA